MYRTRNIGSDSDDWIPTMGKFAQVQVQHILDTDSSNIVLAQFFGMNAKRNAQEFISSLTLTDRLNRIRKTR